jgi:nitrogen fixation protein NifU and related proteins
VSSVDLQHLYQRVILEHGRSPRNFRAPGAGASAASVSNPLCGDALTVHVDLEGDVVRAIGFQGVGCAISLAAASTMTEAVQGHARDQARRLAVRFAEIVRGAQVDLAVDPPDLAVFSGVARYPVRIPCALLSWRGLNEALERGDASLTRPG